MSKEDERIRSIGRKLEDVREHLTVIKNEVAVIERQFELALDELAALADGRSNKGQA